MAKKKGIETVSIPLSKMTTQEFIATLQRVARYPAVPEDTLWKLLGIRKKIDAEIGSFITKRSNLVSKYAAKDESGNLVFLENGNVKINNSDKFNKESSELDTLAAEIEPVKISEFGPAAPNICMEDLYQLEFIVKS